MQEKDKITSAQQEYFTDVLELRILFDLQKGSRMEKCTLLHAYLYFSRQILKKLFVF